MRRVAKLVHQPRTRSRMTGLTLEPFQTLTHRLTPLGKPGAVLTVPP